MVDIGKGEEVPQAILMQFFEFHCKGKVLEKKNNNYISSFNHSFINATYSVHNIHIIHIIHNIHISFNRSFILKYNIMYIIYMIYIIYILVSTVLLLIQHIMYIIYK